jgi:small GTP-binding protein
MPDNSKIKITLIGLEKAGKTALVRRIVTNTFDPEYLSTIGFDSADIAAHRKLANGKLVNFKLVCWDISSLERYRSIAQTYYTNTQYAIGVIDASEDFDKQAAFLANEMKAFPKEASWLIVLTKADLVEDTDKLNEIAAKAQAFLVANLKENTLGVITTSAYADTGIESVVNRVCDSQIKLLEQQQEEHQPPQEQKMDKDSDLARVGPRPRYNKHLRQLFAGLSTNPSMELAPADREQALNIFLEEVRTCDADPEKYEMLTEFAKPYINRHRNPLVDKKFGKVNTSTWNHALQEVRKAALSVLKGSEFVTSEDLSYWRDRSLFAEHRNNSRLIGAFGKTHAQKEIDGLLRKLNR